MRIGISLDDCEKVSNNVTEILDERDFIKEQYFLEVSSTGVEKLLRKDIHLKNHLGEKVALKLFKQINGTKEHEGILESFDEDVITICLEEEKVEIERKSIAQIKTVYDWN